jgi:hypothetical protein
MGSNESLLRGVHRIETLAESLYPSVKATASVEFDRGSGRKDSETGTWLPWLAEVSIHGGNLAEYLGNRPHETSRHRSVLILVGAIYSDTP